MSAEFNDIGEVDSGVGRAMLVGAAAAIVAGLLWAGLGLLLEVEIGWVALGVGALVGLAMSRATALRSRRLAFAAAAFAALGLVAGKAFIFMGMSSRIADEVQQDIDAFAAVYAWELHAAGELEPQTMAAIAATEAAGDTLSDALWEEMKTQARAKLATMSDDEKLEAAEAGSASVIAKVGIARGVMAQVSAFDLLWLFLAVSTAFKIMAAPTDESHGRVPVQV